MYFSVTESTLDVNSNIKVPLSLAFKEFPVASVVIFI